MSLAAQVGKAWLIGMAGMLLGCQSPTPTSLETVGYTLELRGFPNPSSPFGLVVQTRDSGRKLLDDLWLDSVGAFDFYSKTITVSNKTAKLYVYLVDRNDDPAYFTGFDVTGPLSRSLSEQYWIDYGQYFDHSKLEYGVSAAMVRDFAADQPQSFDFSDAPYYLLKAPSAAGSTYRLTTKTTAGYPALQYADNLASLGSGNLGSTLDSWDSPKEFPGLGANRYFYLVPPSYDAAAAMTLTYDDITQQRAQTFPANTMLSFDQGKTLFFAQTDLSWSGTLSTRELRSWEMTTGDVKVVHTFTETISCLAVSGTNLYLGVRNKLWRYTPATGTMTLIATFTNNPTDNNDIKSLSPVGNSLLLVFTLGVASASNWSSLVDLTTLQVTDKKNAGAASRTSVWVPAQGRLYVLRDGWSPNQISSWTVDATAKTLGAYASQSDAGSLTNRPPLLPLGSELTLLTGSGSVYRVDGGTAAYDSNLGFPVVAAGVTAGHLVTLENRSGNATLVSRDATAPFGNAAVLSTWAAETPLGLVSTPDGDFAVGRTNLGRVVVHPYNALPAGDSLTAGRSLSPHRVSGERLAR